MRQKGDPAEDPPKVMRRLAGVAAKLIGAAPAQME